MTTHQLPSTSEILRPSPCWSSVLSPYKKSYISYRTEEMHINADALLYYHPVNTWTYLTIDLTSSLQVFENESHASIHSNRSKEGLSLFGNAFELIQYFETLTQTYIGILNTTHTTLGRSLLRTWFLRPSLSIPVSFPQTTWGMKSLFSFSLGDNGSSRRRRVLDQPRKPVDIRCDAQAPQRNQEYASDQQYP